MNWPVVSQTLMESLMSGGICRHSWSCEQRDTQWRVRIYITACVRRTKCITAWQGPFSSLGLCLPAFGLWADARPGVEYFHARAATAFIPHQADGLKTKTIPLRGHIIAHSYIHYCTRTETIISHERAKRIHTRTLITSIACTVATLAG